MPSLTIYFTEERMPLEAHLAALTERSARLCSELLARLRTRCTSTTWRYATDEAIWHARS